MSFPKELIEKYAPEADCVQAMKIWKLPDGKENMFPEVCNSGNYFAELKKDGYWYEFEKTQNYSYLFSRNISANTGILTEKLDNVPHIKEALNCLPVGTILIGEVYYPGKTSKDVTKIMGCLAPEAIKRQQSSGLIHYYLHDVIKYNGVDLQDKGAWTRYQVLLAIWEKYNLNQYPFMEIAEATLVDIQEFAASALNSGEEGVVLKKKSAAYVPDKRPAWSSVKIKKMDFADCICIGFEDATKPYEGKEIETWPYWEKEDGTECLHSNVCHYGEDGWKPITKGYYYGWKTSMRLGALDDNGNIVNIGTVSSGLTDDLKADFAINPDKYINRVVSIQCMQKDSFEHTLRHGFFKFFRDDKNFKDCLLSTIF